jgi:hypothetical protein
MPRYRIRRAWPIAMVLLLALTGAILGGSGEVRAESAAKPIPIVLPPMGWSSWNSFSNTVDSQIVMAQAKAMISTGMAKAGYRYINIDEGWWLGERDANGNIVVDANAWPALAAGEHGGDMANIVRYIHGLGLKAAFTPTPETMDAACSRTSGPSINTRAAKAITSRTFCNSPAGDSTM